MKFLCVPCDTPMKLQTVAPPDRGSLSVVYSCPECGYEIAMLTNQFETQMVQSLGVRIGPASATATADSADLAPPDAGPKCPFAGMVASTERPEPPADGAVRWTAAAEARLANIPAFVRPMAKTGIEQFARERGAVEVDEKVLDDARDHFGM
jgi:hypothetical protein